MEKPRLSIVVLCALLLSVFQNYSYGYKNNNNESIYKTYQIQGDTNAVRGVWMYGSTLAGADYNALAKKLSDNYVKQVYLLIKGVGGTLTPADRLNGFISAAHAKNLKVYLWYAVADDDAYLAAHPDSHIYHCPKPSLGPYPYADDGDVVNLLYPGYKDYVLNNIKYFITNFDCDGVHLDYIRYTHFVYSFDKYQLYRADSLGVDTTRLLQFFNKSQDNYNYYAVNSNFVNLYTNGDTDVVKWVKMRRNIVNDYITSIKALIQQYKPALKLTAAFMPEGATQPDWADVYYSQSYSLNSPLLDGISPMAYFKEYGESTDWLRTVAQGAIKNVSSNCQISAGIQTFDGVTAQDVSEEIKFALYGGASGIVVFNYESTSDAQWSVIKAAFQTLSQPNSVADNNAMPESYKLNQNYPNPFNPSTEISFCISKSSMVTLKVYDVMGREVSTLLNREMNAGEHKVSFNAQNLSNGVYFYKISAGSFSDTKKMLLLK